MLRVRLAVLVIAPGGSLARCIRGVEAKDYVAKVITVFQERLENDAGYRSRR